MLHIINNRITLYKCKPSHTSFPYQGKKIRVNVSLSQEVERTPEEDHCPCREPELVVQFVASDVSLQSAKERSQWEINE